MRLPMKRILFAAPLLFIAFAGCKPKADGNCKIETKESCTSEKAALACHDGKWEEMPCRGSGGCSKAGKEDSCDQSVANDKDTCNLPSDVVCTEDKKGMLECKGNKWTAIQTCLGTRGCSMETKKVSCDNTVANPGEPCRDDNDYACSPDAKTVVVCRSNKFTTGAMCRGKGGCKVMGEKGETKVECDDSIARVGDPCEKEGHYSCADDEKSIVRCKAKKYELDDTCKKRGEKCAVRGDLVGCY